MTDNQIKKYNELFNDVNEKANAFDKIAECYYYGNFGKMSKSDFDVLMFSLYLDRILDICEEDIMAYSDYKLSKLLGITQSKVSNLKVKKELNYPYKKFDWRESFKRLIGRARFEDGKIYINIPDKNLFNEIKNAIEEKGGYIEKQLTNSLMKVRVEFFLDLYYAISDEKDRKSIISQLSKLNKDNEKLKEQIENQTIYDLLKNESIKGGVELLKEVTCNLIKDKSPIIASAVKNYVFKMN